VIGASSSVVIGWDRNSPAHIIGAQNDASVHAELQLITTQ